MSKLVKTILLLLTALLLVCIIEGEVVNDGNIQNVLFSRPTDGSFVPFAFHISIELSVRDPKRFNQVIVI